MHCKRVINYWWNSLDVALVPVANLWSTVTSFFLWSTSKEGKRSLGTHVNPKGSKQKCVINSVDGMMRKNLLLPLVLGGSLQLCSWLCMSNVVVLCLRQWKNNNYTALSHYFLPLQWVSWKATQIYPTPTVFLSFFHCGAAVCISFLFHDRPLMGAFSVFHSFCSLQMQNLGSLHKQSGGMSLR